MKPLSVIGNLVGLTVLVLILVTDWRKFLSADWRTVMVALLLALAALALGWLLGGPELRTRRMLALTTSTRNLGVALFLAASTFPGTGADAGVLVYAAVMLIADFALVTYWNRRSQPLDVV